MNVALFGHGTVGGGVSRILLNDEHRFSQRQNTPVCLTAISTPHPEEDEEIFKHHSGLFRSADDIFSDASISVICETIGGDTVALDIVKRALESGKHVVTANKKMMAQHYNYLTHLAQKNGVRICFEAAVAGGIPLMSSIENGLSSENVRSLEGIINGTTNFILTEMERTGEGFQDVLQKAQKKGYAEADPTDDIEGHDARYKLSLLISSIFGVTSDPDAISTSGITRVSEADFLYATELGKTIRLMARAQQMEDGIFAEVRPTLVPSTGVFASVSGVLNGVRIVGKYNILGNIFIGEGAGRFPTASAVVADVLSLSEVPPQTRENPKEETYVDKQENNASFTCIEGPPRSWYIRAFVSDCLGIVGEMGSIFARHGISLDGMSQIGNQEGDIHFMITTFPVCGEKMRAAVLDISKKPWNTQDPFVMPIY